MPRLTAFFISLCLILSCTGSTPYFRERWWNYYDRGLSFKDKGKEAAALSDFGAALAQRSSDQRMARTYGMHFIDYFPHRERGIIYYGQDRLEDAEQELSLSIEQYPTAKARYYLDQVRKKQVELSGLGTEPPRLVLDGLTSFLRTRSDAVAISGSAHDPAYVASVTIHQQPVFLEQAKQDVTFDEELSLPQGKHRIDVSATNLAGKTQHRTIEIHVDRQGPLLTLESPDMDGGRVVIRGTVSDPSGIDTLVIQGESVPIKQDIRTEFSWTLPWDARGWSFEITDQLGNATRFTLSGQAYAAWMRTPLYLAELGPTLYPPLFDQTAPEILIRDWSDKAVVFLDRIYIDGMVSDKGGITQLTLNGENLLTATGVLAAFNRFIDLKPGENTLELVATDAHGNTRTRKIVVERRIPSALKLENRLGLTVFPFDTTGKVAFPAWSFQDHMIAELVRENRFRVVDRDFLMNIMDELHISRSGLADPKTRVSIGKLASAQALVGGRMIQSKEGLEIVARVVDTETSDVLATMDVYSDRSETDAVRLLARGLSTKLHREFPLSQGRVISHEGDLIMTDLGEYEIKPLHRILVYLETPIVDKETGHILGSEAAVLSQARVTQVDRDLSKARLYDNNSFDLSKEGKVIAQ